MKKKTSLEAWIFCESGVTAMSAKFRKVYKTVRILYDLLHLKLGKNDSNNNNSLKNPNHTLTINRTDKILQQCNE